MLPRLIVALAATCLVAAPARAELWQDNEPEANSAGWQNSQATTGEQKHLAEKTDTVNAPQPDDQENVLGGSAARGSSNATNKQASVPLLQTVTGAPFTGTFLAPGSLALMEEGKQSLPETRLDPLIGSGLDSSFGDEGEKQAPPLNSFTSIQDAGGVNSLTTGHPSNAPQPVSQGPGM